MKRKLSLFMAAVMALSTLPFTATEVHANTTNRIHGIPGTTVPQNSVFVEHQEYGSSVASGSQWVFPTTRFSPSPLPGNVSGTSLVGVDYAVSAGYLELELRSRQDAGDMFRFELDNGEWLFRSTQAAAQRLTTQWNWHAGAPSGVAGTLPTNAAPLSSTTAADQKASHGIGVPGVSNVQDLILLNSANSVNARVADPTALASSFDGSGFIATMDGPLGQVSGTNEITGQSSRGVLHGGMPPIVRPSDWNFPHGFTDNYDLNAATAVIRQNPPAAVANRINEILAQPVANFATEPPASGIWNLDRHRIGTGLTVTNNDNVALLGRTYDFRRGFFLRDTPGAEGSYVRFANAVRDTLGGSNFTTMWTRSDATALATNPTASDQAWSYENRFGIGTSYRSQPGPLGGSGARQLIEVPYVMDISRVADGRTEATVTLLDDAEPGDIVLVPLVIRVPSSEGATIRLQPAGHRPFVTQGTWHIAAAAGQSTTATVVNPPTAREKFEIEALIIRENRANSIRRLGGGQLTNTPRFNAFDIVLSPGFYFDQSTINNAVVFLERDLTWQSLPNAQWSNQQIRDQIGAANWPDGTTRPAVPGEGMPGVDYLLFFPDGSETSRGRLRVMVDGFNNSQLIEGSLAIYGLTVWAEETVPFDTELEFFLENTSFVTPGPNWGSWIQNNTGSMVAAPAPAGWRVYTGPASGVDYIRVRANGVDFDIVTVTDGTTPGAGWNVRGALIGMIDHASADPAVFATGTGVPGGASVRTFRERTFTVTNPTTTVNFGINAINEQNMISAQGPIRAGTRRDWGVVLRTEGNVPELIAGRYEGPTALPGVEHQTARVVFEEVVPNSWWAGRQVVLSLPEGVKWRRVYFEETRYPPGSPLGNETIAPNTIQRRHYYVNIETPPTGLQLLDGSGVASNQMWGVGGRATTSRHGVHFEDNKMFWTDVLAWRGPLSNTASGVQNRGAYIRFDSWVSIAADFNGGRPGDIILTASGTAVPTETNITMPSAIIATVLPPVYVSIEDITDVRIGFQHQPTVDIVITESRAGALMRDRNVRLSVTDLVATDILFGPSVNIEVTNSAETGFTIKNQSTGLAGSLFGGGTGLVPTMGIEANRGTISFDVATISHRVPASITVSNVSVRVDRTVPETNDVPYWVVVWGNAIANNFGNFDTRPVGQSAVNWPMHERTNLDRFLNNPGIFTDFIRVVSGGDGSPWLTQEVRVTIGELWYSVNGIQYDMDVAALLDPASSSTFVPLRFIANAFGLADDQIVWDNHNRTATIVLPTGRVVQFAADSPVMLDNGAPRNITNANGEAITPMIVTINENDGGRMFLPFRFFGEVVLGVPVAWEASTQTAVFNPSGSLGR